MENVEFKAAIKGGRSRSARDPSGHIVHLVEAMPSYRVGYWGGKSLCGAEPGSRSYGWSESIRESNCPKCLKKYNQNNS